MNTEHGNLTQGEQRYLERMREAEEEGVSLPDYYRSHGLSLRALHRVRDGLIGKGVLARAGAKQPTSKEPSSLGPFAVVRVAPPVSVAARGGCRLISPSGWVIECDGLPEVSWLESLMGVRP